MRALGRHRAAGLAAIALIIALAPIFFPSMFYYRMGTAIFIAGIAVVGLNILMGLAGQVSLGHAGFYGIGAYSVAVLPAQYEVHGLVAIAFGIVVAGVLAWIVGRPILRLKGHYLAVATLGFGVLVSMVLTNEGWLTGGPDGMSVKRLTLFGYVLRDRKTWYWVSAAVLLLAALVATNIIDSPTGRALRALHDSEVGAAVNGIDVAHYKLTAFVISACYASLAGALAALSDAFITPASAGFLKSIELVTMVVLGGMGSMLGAFWGGFAMGLVQQLSTYFLPFQLQNATIFLLFLAVVLLRPQGLFGKSAERT